MPSVFVLSMPLSVSVSVSTPSLDGDLVLEYLS